MKNSIYDEQIAYLTKHPEEIYVHWLEAKGLFKMVEGNYSYNSGCLTMIRNKIDGFKACIKGEVDEELTQSIINDERIPFSGELITVAHLPVFKEWQEKIDKLQNS